MNLIAYRGDVRPIGLAALTLVVVGIVFITAWSWLGVLLFALPIVAGAAIWTVWSTRGPSPMRIVAGSASMIMAIIVGFFTVPAWAAMLIDRDDSILQLAPGFIAILGNFSITFLFVAIVSRQPLTKILTITIIGMLLGILIFAGSFAGLCASIDGGCFDDS